MSKECLCIALLALMMICDTGGAAAAGRRAGRPAAGTTTAPRTTMETSKDKTDLDTFTLYADGDLKHASTGSIDWQTRVPGYNIVRSFLNNANKTILFVLNGNSGEAETFVLNADGSMGPTGWWTGLNPLKELRCTGAEIVKTRNGTKLITQDYLTGRIRIITLNQD